MLFTEVSALSYVRPLPRPLSLLPCCRLAYRMKILKLPLIFMSAEVCEGTGVMLRHVAASDESTWQTGRREMSMVTVAMRGMIACQGDPVVAKNISHTSVEIII